MLDSPPTSDVFSDEMDSSSTRDKTLLNKSIAKHNNFKTDYLPVDNTKPCARGRKTFAFWTLVALLFILAIGNLILTMTILAVLKVGEGMENMEVIPYAEAVKLFGNVDLDHIYKRDGRLEGYEGESVAITSEDSAIILNLEGYSRPGRASMKLKISKNETAFRGFNSFNVKNANEEEIFTVTEPIFTSLKNGRHMKAKRIQTNKIRSANEDNLKIDAEKINFRGAEGTRMEGKEIVWSAEEDIYLISNGSIALRGQDGTYIDVRRTPIAISNSNSYVTAQFKVCVCMPSGKLFRIPVVNPRDRVYCHHVNMQHNFCM